MTKLLDGKKLAEKVFKEIQEKIRSANLKLKLAVIFVGENPASQAFVNQKGKMCQAVDVGFEVHKYPETIKTAELVQAVRGISANPQTSGLIIQLPLPVQIDEQTILNGIPPEKDPDVLTRRNTAQFYLGNFSLLPPVLAGIVRIFDEYKIKLNGKNVLVVGAGKLVGKPAAFWAISQEATVMVANALTKKLSDFTKKADIIISGAGKAGLIKGSMVKKGVVIIDAGTSLKKVSKKGKKSPAQLTIVGDVDFKTVSKKASYITPVPGGVGPMTVAMLLENLIKLNLK